MKKIILLIILLTAVAVNGFSYTFELSAGVNDTKENTWTYQTSPWINAQRKIHINMDVYNLDNPGTTINATARAHWIYTNSQGNPVSDFRAIDDEEYGPGGISYGTYTYNLLNQVSIRVWRSQYCQAGRSMAWARVDTWW